MAHEELAQKLSLSFSSIFSKTHPRLPGPVILARSNINGHLHVTTDDIWTLNSTDIIRIQFIGRLSSTVNHFELSGKDVDAERDGASAGFDKKIIRVSDRRTANVNLSSQSLHRRHVFAFNFTLPQSCDHTNSPSSGDLWDSLPSSLHLYQKPITRLDGHIPETDVEVRYYVRATVFRRGVVIGCVTEPIVLLRALDNLPPICPSDFDSEYVLNQDAILRKSVVSKYGSIRAEVRQPEAFAFENHKDAAMTKINLNLTLESDWEYLDEFLLDSLVADVSWRLRISTFVSSSGFLGIPTAQCEKNDPKITSCVVYGPVHCFRSGSLNWRRGYPPIGDVWEAEESFWLALSKRSLYPPTFSTPNLVRRYGIELTISLHGAAKAKLDFRIPCQIMYCSDVSDPSVTMYSTLQDQSAEQMLRNSFDDDELPEYCA